MPASSETDAVDLESYFDRPEVKAAYLAQKAIQVPEFSPLPDDAVGARLRARAPEESEETQDWAYIKRHQRYDTFEKRQRKREKERLVHEQYQIRQRIDQLKNMEASELGPGEARLKEFLASAITLDGKYTILLPPEPRRPKKNGKKLEGVRAGMRAGTTTGEDADTEGETPTSTSTRPHAERINHAKPASQQPSPMPPPAPKTPAVTVALEVNEVPHAPRSPEYIAPNAFNAPPKRESGRVAAKAEAKPTSRKRPLPETAPEPEVTAVPPRKRPRADARATPMEAPPHTQSVLLQIAMRKAAQPRARQTSRVIHAFGFGIPGAIEEEVYYELPENVISQSALEDQYRKKLGSVSDGDPPEMDGSAEEYGPGYWSKEPGYLNGVSGLNGLSTIRETSEDAMDVDGARRHS